MGISKLSTSALTFGFLVLVLLSGFQNCGPKASFNPTSEASVLSTDATLPVINTIPGCLETSSTFTRSQGVIKTANLACPSQTASATLLAEYTCQNGVSVPTGNSYPESPVVDPTQCESIPSQPAQPKNCSGGVKHGQNTYVSGPNVLVGVYCEFGGDKKAVYKTQVEKICDNGNLIATGRTKADKNPTSFVGSCNAQASKNCGARQNQSTWVDLEQFYYQTRSCGGGGSTKDKYKVVVQSKCNNGLITSTQTKTLMSSGVCTKPPLNQPVSRKVWTLTDQYTVTGCKSSDAAETVPTPFGETCSTLGATTFVHWGAANDAIKIDGGACPAGQGPIARNVYTCIECNSDNMGIESWMINNGDINFQGATMGVLRIRCN